MFPRQEWKKGWEWRKELQTKKISSNELTHEYLSRAKKCELNAFITITEIEAMKAADSYDTGKMQGKLAGLPIGIKDNLVTEGIRTTCGSKILSNYIPPYSATVVQKLEAAGAISIGKCNMDEFAMGSSNEHSAYGAVSLPQDTSRVPGGSSGGSAAAVAAGLAVMSLGSDTGGSVRQPASFCGVVGLKPTYGRISRYGLVAYASSLDQVGPLALDAQDCADLLEVISGNDPLDSTSFKKTVPAYGAAVEKIRTNIECQKDFMQNLRVGVPAEFFAEGLNEKVRNEIERAIQKMQKAGAKIIPVHLPHSKYALPVYYVVAVSEASANLSRYDGVRYGPRVLPHGAQSTLEEMYEHTRGELFGKEVKRRILLGTFALSSGYYDAYYKKACQVRNLITQDFLNSFKECDVLVGPTTPTTSFTKGEKSDPLTMYLNDIFTVPVNLAGLPAISMPWGNGDNNLPIGLQFIAPHFGEQKLLELTAAMEILHDE